MIANCVCMSMKCAMCVLGWGWGGGMSKVYAALVAGEFRTLDLRVWVGFLYHGFCVLD